MAEAARILEFGEEKSKRIKKKQKKIEDKQFKRCYPFSGREEIEQIKTILYDRVENSGSMCQEQINYRNLLAFVLGINIGIRAIDLLTLKWSKIFCNNVVREHVWITEHKTEKDKEIFINSSSEKILNEYASRFSVDVNCDKYIFFSRNKSTAGVENNHIKPNMLWRIMKGIAKDANIGRNIATHSLRKTFASEQMKAHPNDSMFMRELMDLLNHTSIESTLHYIGADSERQRKYVNEVNL